MAPKKTKPKSIKTMSKTKSKSTKTPKSSMKRKSSKTNSVVPVAKVLHPSLEVGRPPFDVYDYDQCELNVKKTLLQYLLMHLHVRNIRNVRDVRICKLSKDGAMPIVLQARAERPFKKGTLVLSPLGAVELDDEATAYQLQRPKNKKWFTHP